MELAEVVKLLEWAVRQIEKLLDVAPQAADPADSKPEVNITVDVQPALPTVPNPDETV